MIHSKFDNTATYNKSNMDVDKKNDGHFTTPWVQQLAAAIPFDVWNMAAEWQPCCITDTNQGVLHLSLWLDQSFEPCINDSWQELRRPWSMEGICHMHGSPQLQVPSCLIGTYGQICLSVDPLTQEVEIHSQWIPTDHDGSLLGVRYNDNTIDAIYLQLIM
uniref:Uncharacterized protein n=1 Tax=viral metagenome TaxID=1070528 RepID=A0A6C0BJ97_9ZZZZ